MLEYNDFLNENIKSIKRDNLSINTYVKINGNIDGVDIKNEIGKIIQIWEYGKILIQFISKFSDRLHSGYKENGESKKCFYVNINNIVEIIPVDLSEKIDKKTILPFKISKKLSRIFNKIKFDPKTEYLDMSFFDVEPKDQNIVSYISSKRFEGEVDSLKGRQKMRVGKLLKKLNPDLKETDIEDLTDKYRAAYNIIILNNGIDLDLVTGEDIRFWYSNVNYKKPNNSSTLWNSCMSGPSCSIYFNIYCENPDKIALCIHLDDDNKLLARALVWKLDNGKIYMDRIYSYNNAYKNILREYAINNAMLLYAETSETLRVTLPKDYAKKDRPKNGNPYMDTMRHMSYEHGAYILTNRPSGSYGYSGIYNN